MISNNLHQILHTKKLRPTGDVQFTYTARWSGFTICIFVTLVGTPVSVSKKDFNKYIEVNYS